MVDVPVFGFGTLQYHDLFQLNVPVLGFGTLQYHDLSVPVLGFVAWHYHDLFKLSVPVLGFGTLQYHDLFQLSVPVICPCAKARNSATSGLHWTTLDYIWTT